jgi:hypothetical protein
MPTAPVTEYVGEKKPTKKTPKKPAPKAKPAKKGSTKKK